jgi:hypothetical protein
MRDKTRAGCDGDGAASLDSRLVPGETGLHQRTLVKRHMGNFLIGLIQAGKVHSLEDLRSAYRRAVLKTHPDAVGSNKYLESYLKLTVDFDEAKTYLARAGKARDDRVRTANHRLAFFQQLGMMETLETPYAFRPGERGEELRRAREAAAEELTQWRPALAELYAKADREYSEIKAERPMGPYLKHAMALNMRPLMHNLIGYHLTGREVYSRQARQNLSGIMHQLAENGRTSLAGLLTLLLEDVKNGAAVFD